MSDALAIAAVTATLRNLIMRGTAIPQDNVTTVPPDKVRKDNKTPEQLNLFLYQTVLNGAWRNMDIPRQTKAGETGQPPLALNLHYLLTAYGAGDDDVSGHGWLGKAMLTLHDHPVLGADELAVTLPNDGPRHVLQVERVRITPHPMSLDDMSKLWTTFQTQYRISAAYEVEVLLIESTRARRTPLPVLTRGEDDRGVHAQPDLSPPFPTIIDVRPPNRQTSARLGETVTIEGFHLDGDTVEVRFTRSPAEALPLQPASGTSEKVEVVVPNDPTKVPAGLYTIAVRTTKAGAQERFTNEWPLQIAPVIFTINPVSAVTGDVTYTVTCLADVRPDQTVSLLIGDREVPADSHSTTTRTLTFAAKALPKGDYFVRLRIDGVDSLLVVRGTTPPSFDASQKVTIT